MCVHSCKNAYFICNKFSPCADIERRLLLESEYPKDPELQLTVASWNLWCTQVDLKVRIAPGIQHRMVIVRELTALQATWAIFDRQGLR